MILDPRNGIPQDQLIVELRAQLAILSALARGWTVWYFRLVCKKVPLVILSLIRFYFLKQLNMMLLKTILQRVKRLMLNKPPGEGVKQVPSAVGALGRLAPNLLTAFIRKRGKDFPLSFKEVCIL